MRERITDKMLAEYQERADEFELDTRTWSDRDELLQALKAERERIKELEKERDQLLGALEFEKERADGLAKDFDRDFDINDYFDYCRSKGWIKRQKEGNNE